MKTFSGKMAWYSSPNKKKKPKTKSTPSKEVVDAANVEIIESIEIKPIQVETTITVEEKKPQLEVPPVTHITVTPKEEPVKQIKTSEEVKPEIFVVEKEPEEVILEPIQEAVLPVEEYEKPIAVEVISEPEVLIIEEAPIEIELVPEQVVESVEERTEISNEKVAPEDDTNPLDILQLPDDANVILTEEQLDKILSKIKENVIESIAQGETGNIEPVFPVNSTAEKFRQLSKKPFELRYKGVKIFDSYTNKKETVFELDYVWVGGRKYPYQHLTITNK